MNEDSLEVKQAYNPNVFSFDQDPLSRLPAENTYEQLRSIHIKIDQVPGSTPDQKKVVLHLARAVLEAKVDPLKTSMVSDMFTNPDDPGKGSMLKGSFEEGVVEGARPGGINAQAIIETIKRTSRADNDDVDKMALNWVGIAAGEFSTGGPIASMRIMEAVANNYYGGKVPDWMKGVIERMSQIADAAYNKPAQLGSKILDGDQNRLVWFEKNNPESVQARASRLLTLKPQV